MSIFKVADGLTLGEGADLAATAGAFLGGEAIQGAAQKYFGGTAAIGAVRDNIENIGNALSSPVKNYRRVPMSGTEQAMKISQSTGGPNVKTLYDALVEKLASQRQPQAKVATSDVDFIDKLAAGLPEMTKTAQGGILDMLSQGASAVGGALSGLPGKAVNALPTALALTALGTTGGAAIGAMYDTAKDKFKSHEAYAQMFEEFPELKEMPRDKIDKYWQVLRDYSPHLTINPLVAGQFISNMMSYGMKGVDHNTIQQIVGIQNTSRQAKSTGDIIKAMGGLTQSIMQTQMQHGLGSSNPDVRAPWDFMGNQPNFQMGSLPFNKNDSGFYTDATGHRLPPGILHGDPSIP